MRLFNKVVLVTGASSGIGAATALEFARRGMRLVLAGRDADRLRASAAACAAAGARAAPLALAADLATDQGCELVAKETLGHFGRLDVLVNNAGVTARTTLARADMATFDRVFATDVRAVYQLTRLLAPALRRARGCVVNVSSIAATKPVHGTLPYGMAKAALDHFTRLIALELAPDGVRVNTVSPGVTVSNLVKRATNCSDEEYAAWLKAVASAVPLRRVCSPQHVAEAIVFLASCELVTGALLKVDGGLELGTNDDLFLQQLK